MVYTAVRFVRYYRISHDYNERVDAKVDSIHLHESTSKKAPRCYDVVLEYKIDGKKGRSEIHVPVEKADSFAVGTIVSIRYKVSENGAVHIASDDDTFAHLTKVYGIAIVVEFAVFFVLWLQLIK